jgi:hypothetical protein
LKNKEKQVFFIGWSIGLTLLVLIMIILVLSAVPPVSRDALTHHLAVPKLYIKNGCMLELPEIIPSYFPMNLDMLFLIPLLWGNDILPKYIHMAFGLFTAVLLYRYLRNRLNRIYGILGMLLFLSLPIIVQLAITVYHRPACHNGLCRSWSYFFLDGSSGVSPGMAKGRLAGEASFSCRGLLRSRPGNEIQRPGRFSAADTGGADHCRSKTSGAE